MALKKSPYALALARIGAALRILLGLMLWTFFVVAHPVFDAPGAIQTSAMISIAAGLAIFIVLQLRAWMVSCSKCNASIAGASLFAYPVAMLLAFDAHRTCPQCGNDNTAP